MQSLEFDPQLPKGGGTAVRIIDTGLGGLIPALMEADTGRFQVWAI